MNFFLLFLFFLQLICVHSVQSRSPRELTSFRDEKESERHHLVSHPFADQGEREKEGNSKDQDDKSEDLDNRGGRRKRPFLSKKDNQEEMGLHWHLYFGAMIVGTLLGLKILSSWEERIDICTQEQLQAKLSHQELCQEFEDSRSMGGGA